jgi:hypothetical protein
MKPAAATGASATQWNTVQQQFYLSAKAGKEWLLRVNGPNGRFLPGLEPSLRFPIPVTDQLHQAAAACVLARCAKFFKDERAAAVARQALLTLLLETQKDPGNPQVRVPMSLGTNPLALAGWLVLAIGDLPEPGADLRQQAEELCQYIRGQQQQDGSLGPAPPPGEPKASAKIRSAWTAAGLALYALARSQRLGPQSWKLETVRKAREYYQAQWRTNKNTEMVPWHAAAFAEAYFLTKEQAFAQCANEMNDWLVTLQYREIEPQRQSWNGGFKKWHDGTVQTEMPDVHSAVYMEGLAQGCRLARESGDLPRYQAYQQALEQCGRFLLTLQYTEANAQHFEAEFRQRCLLGGFHATHHSGLLRLDFTQQAVSGLVKYLTDATETK